MVKIYNKIANIDVIEQKEFVKNMEKLSKLDFVEHVNFFHSFSIVSEDGQLLKPYNRPNINEILIGALAKIDFVNKKIKKLTLSSDRLGNIQTASLVNFVKKVFPNLEEISFKNTGIDKIGKEFKDIKCLKKLSFTDSNILLIETSVRSYF